MKGLVSSCTVALEANNKPTLTFSLISLLVERGQSVEFCGSPPSSIIAADVGGTAPVDTPEALEPDNLTVLSYKDTIVSKAPGGVCCCGKVSFSTPSADSSRLYR